MDAKWKIKNFFGLLKNELTYQQTFKSIEDYKQEMKYYLDY